MPNTYSQLFVHFVFAVKGRHGLIPPQHKDELHQYMTGLVKNRDAKMLAVHCMPDHCHLFVSLKPTTFIPDFIKEIKVATTRFINDKRWLLTRFAWQEGYGAFSYGRSQIESVIAYIIKQESHHSKTTFREEYCRTLMMFDIPLDEQYLFQFIDDLPVSLKN